MKRAALYARVSTGGQTTENQLRELEAGAGRLGWAIVARYVDQGLSGAKGRSLQELVGILGELREREVDLYLHQQGLDTGTPSGRAMYQMLGVFAEFERAIIVERIKAGMARARERGKRLSRPLTPEEVRERITELRAQGHSLRWIAEEVGVSKSTVANYVKDPA